MMSLKLLIKKYCIFARILALTLAFGILIAGCAGNPAEVGDGIITGTVTDSQGNPIEGAFVSTSPSTMGVRTDSAGGYSITGLKSARYTVKASKAGYRSGTSEASLTKNVFGCAPYPAKNDFKLTKESEGNITGAVYGTVKDENGNLISGTKIITYPTTVETVTDSAGAYFLSDLEPGNYTVRATKPGYADDAKISQVTADTESKLELEISATKSSVIGLILDPNGNKIKGAAVYLNSASPVCYSDSNGVYAITKISSGIYTMKVLKNDYKDYIKELTVDAGRTASVDIIMDKKERVAGNWYHVAVPSSENILSISMVSFLQGWAVGNYGHIVKLVPGGWQRETTPTVNKLLSVSMASATSGWAVGDNGTIVKYDGETWSLYSSPVIKKLYSVFMSSSMSGWIVGELGTVLKYDGMSWLLVQSPTQNDLLCVYMNSETEGWAVGANGEILKYADTIWSKFSSPTTEKINGVYVSSAYNTGWAVGYAGMILKYDGVNWTKFTKTALEELRAVLMIGYSDGWIVGNTGTMLRYNGVNWEQQSNVTTHSLYSISPTRDSDDLWACGENAVIINFRKDQ